MRRLNLRLLEVFRTVYEADGITAASVRLHVTQPAVSKAISQLEAELGTSLFFRVHGRLQPTTEADSLYSEYRKLFESIQGFEHYLQAFGQEMHLSVAAIPALAGWLVATATSQLRAKMPAAKVDIVTAQSADVISQVRHHRVTFGLVHGPVRISDTIDEIIGEGEIVAAMSADYVLADKDVLTPSDLDGIPVIQLDAGSPPSHLVKQAFRSAGVTLNVVLEVNNSAVANTVAMSGLGVALVDPWSSINSTPTGLIIRHFAPRIPLRIVLVRSASRHFSAADRAMIAAVRETIKLAAVKDTLVRMPSVSVE